MKTRITFFLAVTGYTLHVIPVVRDMFPLGWTWNVLGPQAMGTILFLIAATLETVLVHQTIENADRDVQEQTTGTNFFGTLRTAYNQ